MKDTCKVYKNTLGSSECLIETYDMYGRTVGDEMTGGVNLGAVSSLIDVHKEIKKHKDKYDHFVVYENWYDGHYNESGDGVGDVITHQIMHVYDKKGKFVYATRIC